MDLVANGARWLVHLTIEVNGLRTEYKFEATETGSGATRRFVGTPICGGEVPLYDEADAGSGSRSSSLNFSQGESSRGLVLIGRHPVSSAFRRLQFKPR